jgi:hypothetical protein
MEGPSRLRHMKNDTVDESIVDKEAAALAMLSNLDVEGEVVAKNHESVDEGELHESLSDVVEDSNEFPSMSGQRNDSLLSRDGDSVISRDGESRGSLKDGREGKEGKEMRDSKEMKGKSKKGRRKDDPKGFDKIAEEIRLEAEKQKKKQKKMEEKIRKKEEKEEREKKKKSTVFPFRRPTAYDSFILIYFFLFFYFLF